MPIRKPKPTSPGRRFVSYADYAEITKTEPERSLVEGLKKSGGRNAHGRKTARDAAGRDAGRHARAQRRAAAGPRRPARALGRLQRPADGQGGRYGHPAPAL